MIGSVEEEDRREERRRQREEARANRGGAHPPAILTQFDGSTGNHHHEIKPDQSGDVAWSAELSTWAPNSEVDAPAPPTPAAMPTKAAAPAARPAAFELVDELPNSKGRHGRRYPAVRAQLVEFAKAHPGQWIRYNPTPDDPFKSPSSIATQVRKGHGGFEPGFEANVRDKVLFVRYVGEQASATP